MTTVCLIRHGETDWNREDRLQGREDVKLNDNGRRQALSCVAFLKQHSWDSIITSPLERAKETAYIIGKNICVKNIYEVHDFIERDFGAASGLLYNERKLRFPDGKIEGQEDRVTLTNRVMSALTKVANENNNKKIIIVSHGGVINSILAAITNNEIGSGKTKLKNTCLNLLNFSDGKWKIEFFNLTADEIDTEEAI